MISNGNATARNLQVLFDPTSLYQRRQRVKTHLDVAGIELGPAA